ncbi:hypothetical protein [Deinococcus ruber]|nr:hypothetical protein [Deinococcus ruber]
MDDLPSTLSWSAISAGWLDLWLDVKTLRSLAEERIMTATGEALIPLSELLCSDDQTPRSALGEVLKRLAHLEGWPPALALREWQVVRLSWALARLPELNAAKDHQYLPYSQMAELRGVWHDIGEPLDLPPLSPFVEHGFEVPYGLPELSRTIDQLRTWLTQQHELLRVAQTLQEAGYQHELQVMTAALGTLQVHAQEHLTLLNVKSQLLDTFRDPSQYEAFYMQLGKLNAYLLQEWHRRVELEPVQGSRSPHVNSAL